MKTLASILLAFVLVPAGAGAAVEAAVGATGAAATCRASSGPLTVPLVELYTSEGCDSCPPADRWMSESFAGQRGAAVALAFHVDYWDRLGWKDRFASAAYTARQQRAADASAGFIYTPQVLVQGRDSRWRDAGIDAALARTAARPARASIELAAERVGSAVKVTARASIVDPSRAPGAALAVAYVDSGLVSDVKAGENRGVRLRHDHVVRALTTATRVDGDGRLALDTTLAVPGEAGRSPALVAFVERGEGGDVLQALQLSLAGCPPP